MTLPPPTLRLGTRTIQGHWDGRNQAVISDIQIDWGRHGLLEEVSPATMRCAIIDPSGFFGVDASLNGQEAMLTDAEGIVRFRGRIATTSAELRRIPDPGTNRGRERMVITVTAVDPLSEASSTIRPSDGNYSSPLPDLSSARHRSSWPAATVQARLASIGRAAPEIFTSITVPTDAPTFVLTGWRWPDHRHSILQLLNRAYASCGPLMTAACDHKTGAAIPVAPVQAVPVALKYADGVISIDTTAKRLPAVHVTEPATRALVADSSSAISNATVAHDTWLYADTPDPDVADATTARTRSVGISGHGREITIDTDLMDDGGFYGITSAEFNTYMANLSAMLTQINGWATLQNPTVLPAAFENADAETLDLLLSCYQRPESVIFSGGRYSHLPRVPTQWQIIGGTLSYRDGWRHTLRLAPAMANTPTLTLGELSAHSSASIDDFDDDITLADLAALTEGIAA